MSSKEPTRQELIEAQKGARVYEGVYNVHFEKDIPVEEVHLSGPSRHFTRKGEYNRKVRYVFDAKDDENALDKALKQYPTTITFLLDADPLLRETIRRVTLEHLSEKRFVSVPGQEPYVWTAEDFGLKSIDFKVIPRIKL